MDDLVKNKGVFDTKEKGAPKSIVPEKRREGSTEPLGNE